MEFLTQAPLSLLESSAQTPIHQAVPNLSVTSRNSVENTKGYIPVIESVCAVLAVNEFTPVFFVRDCPESRIAAEHVFHSVPELIFVGAVVIIATPALAHTPVVGNERPGVHDNGSVATLERYHAPEAAILVETDSICKIVHYVIGGRQNIAKEEVTELNQPKRCNHYLPASFYQGPPRVPIKMVHRRKHNIEEGTLADNRRDFIVWCEVCIEAEYHCLH